jgi:hypothetical protein
MASNPSSSANEGWGKIISSVSLKTGILKVLGFRHWPLGYFWTVNVH